MNNWTDTLIIQYKDGRKELGKMKNNLGESDIDKNDKSKINSMIGSMTHSIEWMEIGRDPDVIRGIDVNKAYQKKAFADMDIFPAALMPDERELNQDEKQAVMNIMMNLSARERQCLLMSKAYMMSYAEIGEELNLGRSTVQKYVERAKNKISCRANVVQCS